ncbi:MAG: enoyl-CoA hydratase/isomerase family protein [Pseudoxanthomonas sp.]
MSEDLVLVERHGSVALLTLNVPKKRNALSRWLARALADALETAALDKDVRALVLNGGAHFCAGGDLDDLAIPALEMRAAMQHGHRAIRALTGGRLPVVAAVQGSAFGAGFALALACDFIVVDANSTFGSAFAKVGLTPDYGMLWSLPQRVGMGTAREILMFAEPIKGEQAKAIGLADRLVETGQVLPAALELAAKLAALPPGTVATTKAVLSRTPMALDPMLAWEADTQAMMVGTADFAEGIKAFAERRAAVFKGA